MSFYNSPILEQIINHCHDSVFPGSSVLYRKPGTRMRQYFAVVEDNKDPEGCGRVKVCFPQIGDNMVTGWIPILRPYAGKQRGFWAMPDVGDYVVCTFINDHPGQAVVMGCIYTPKIKPPLPENPDNNLKVLTTRSGSRIILDDTDGGERILIHTKDGEMRLVLDKAKGLEIVNDKGDINIKCRKFIVEAGDNTNFTFKKDCSVTCDRDKLTLKTDKGMAFVSGKDAVLSGSKIKIKGDTGVTAGMKQMAKKDDQVVGVDMHDIQVPSSSGLVTVPMIPHPYMGKLVDKLSDNVTINDKPAAMKGSKSKYSTPGHIPMPPGVKFASQPNNEGEVSSGTEPTVKINDKEAAVLGSMVKTCNDPQPQETCTVVAVGVAVALPILVPGIDPEQFEKDNGFLVNPRDLIAPADQPLPQDIQRSLNNPKWSASKAGAGEEVTLSVSLSNQYENANVFFTIWEEGADREKDKPVKKLAAPNKGGAAEVKWRYRMDDFTFKPADSAIADYYKEKLGVDINYDKIKHFIDNYEEAFDNPVKKTAKFLFTCKSYRCSLVESGTIEIGDDIDISFVDEFNNPLKDVQCNFMSPDTDKEDKKTGSDGKFTKKAAIPGRGQLRYELKQNK